MKNLRLLAMLSLTVSLAACSTGTKTSSRKIASDGSLDSYFLGDWTCLSKSCIPGSTLKVTSDTIALPHESAIHYDVTTGDSSDENWIQAVYHGNTVYWMFTKTSPILPNQEQIQLDFATKPTAASKEGSDTYYRAIPEKK